MKENAQLWAEAAPLVETGPPAALATVARQRGSLPMAGDAKMLVVPSGRSMGTIGGGGVEADVIRQALQNRRPEDAFEAGELAGLNYASKLTLTADQVTTADIEVLRQAGLDDGQILEINQVTAYFSYANRTVLGLGINTKNDIIGLSPGDSTDPDNWSHD